MNVDRILSGLAAIVCLYFIARAGYLLYILGQVEVFLPATMKPSGEPACPPFTMFDGETEQILIIVVCLIGLLAARLLWRRGVARAS